MKRAPRKRFHLSTNEASADPVSKSQSNKLQPANISGAWKAPGSRREPPKGCCREKKMPAPPLNPDAPPRVKHPFPSDAPADESILPASRITAAPPKIGAGASSDTRTEAAAGFWKFPRTFKLSDVGNFHEQKLGKRHQKNQPSQLLTPRKTLHIHTRVGGIIQKCKSAGGQTQQRLDKCCI